MQNEINKKKQDIFQGNEVMDGMVNWENSSSDGDEFSITEHRKRSKERRGLKCFEEYLQRKKKTKRKDLEKLRKAQEKSSKLKKQDQVSEQLH